MAAFLACVKLHALAFGRTIAPTLLAIGLVLAVVLGGHAIPPGEVVRVLRASAIARLVTPLAWALVVRAGGASLVFPPGAAWVRSAPLSQRWQRFVAASFVVAAQAPLVGVAIAGRDPLLAALLGLVAGTLACAPVDRRGITLFLASIVLVVPSPESAPLVALRVLAGIVVFTMAIGHAWRTAPLRVGARTLRLRRIPVIVQLALAHVRDLIRERPLVVMRGFLGSALALLLVEHVRRAGSLDPWDRTSILQLAAIVTLITAGPLVGPAGRLRRALRRWMRASPTPRVVGLLAAIVVVTTPALSFAAGFGVTQARVESPLSAVGATLAIALFCLALGALLVRMEEVVHAWRRDARFVLVLPTIALALVFVFLAALPAAAMIAVVLLFFVVALVAPEPEVPFADDA